MSIERKCFLCGNAVQIGSDETKVFTMYDRFLYVHRNCESQIKRSKIRQSNDGFYARELAAAWKRFHKTFDLSAVAKIEITYYDHAAQEAEAST